MGAAVLLLCLEGVLLSLVLLALVAIAYARLWSRSGRLDDGVALNSRTPSWRAADTGGREWHEQSRRWRYLLFVDHSLASYPRLPAGLEFLRRRFPEVDVLILCRRRPDLTKAVADGMGLDVPVIDVGERGYAKFNVRLMPFAVVVDCEGMVRTQSLAAIHRPAT